MGIQALRGLAASMVVVCHTAGNYQHHYGGWRWENGRSGVDIFFIISGFVMAVSALSKPNLTAGQFLRQRIVRIVPLYWIMTSIMLIKMHIPMLSPAGHAEASASYVIYSLLFIPYRNSIGEIVPVVGQGWTLCYEMFFYLLLSIALLLKKRDIRFTGGILIVISLAGMFYRDTWPAVASLINPIMIEFLLGLLIGSALIKFNDRVNAFLGLVGIVGLILIPVSTEYRPLVWGIPALLLVQSSTRWNRIPEAILKIGDASYSLYLSHIFVVLFISRMIGKIPELTSIAICLTASIGASLIIYRFVEKPLTDKLRNILENPLVNVEVHHAGI